MLTGRDVDAEEAERIGLVSRQVPAEDLLPACYEIAARIAAFSRPGTELTKRTLWTGLDASTLEGHMQARARAALRAPCLPPTSKRRSPRVPRSAPGLHRREIATGEQRVITATDLEVRAGARTLLLAESRAGGSSRRPHRLVGRQRRQARPQHADPGREGEPYPER